MRLSLQELAGQAPAAALHEAFKDRIRAYIAQHLRDPALNIERMAQGNLDVVLMDCQMPVKDGYTATREWRQHELSNNLRRLPVIAMTANAMAGDRQKCLDAGMDDYLSKPVDRRLLEATLARWLAARPVSADPPAAAAPPASAPAPAMASRPPWSRNNESP